MSGEPPVPRVGGGKRLTAGEILGRLTARYGDKVRAAQPILASGNSSRGMTGGAPFAVVPREHASPILAFLRDDPDLRFDALTDVTAVDHLLLEVPEIPERFAVVYQLTSYFHGHRIQVKVPVPEDDPRLPSVMPLWRSAQWGERETHDMFGIEFEGNPDLRRLLMPENYPGFPLRKDYPLRGRGERDSFPQYRPGGGPAGEGDRRAQPAV